MASRSSANPSPQATGQARLRMPARGSWVRTAVIVFAGLLILFRWLHLILALQIASTGRQMQIATQELQRIERHNATLVLEISAAESPQRLEERARELGYQPARPAYVRSEQPLAPPAAAARLPQAVSNPEPGPASGTTFVMPWPALSHDPGASAQREIAP